MTTAHRYSKYLIIHDDEVDVRTGVGEKKHRIKLARIVDVAGFESGWVTFKYNKTPTLGLGNGVDEVGIEIKPHSVAPALAAYLAAKRDEANRVSLYGRTA
jgi:hypothetical protein